MSAGIMVQEIKTQAAAEGKGLKGALSGFTGMFKRRPRQQPEQFLELQDITRPCHRKTDSVQSSEVSLASTDNTDFSELDITDAQ
eukprot:jgi/Chrzof1/4603/Cz14g19250.t1